MAKYVLDVAVNAVFTVEATSQQEAYEVCRAASFGGPAGFELLDPDNLVSFSTVIVPEGDGACPGADGPMIAHIQLEEGELCPECGEVSSMPVECACAEGQVLTRSELDRLSRVGGLSRTQLRYRDAQYWRDIRTLVHDLDARWPGGRRMDNDSVLTLVARVLRRAAAQVSDLQWLAGAKEESDEG